MSQYIMRLDDASEDMDVEKWQRMEDLLDKYHIKPIVGVIPNNQDPDMVGVYPKDEQFWEKVQRWKEKGWTIALHGYTHVFETREGGLNPVNDRSEFAGVPLERQKEKGADWIYLHTLSAAISTTSLRRYWTRSTDMLTRTILPCLAFAGGSFTRMAGRLRW